MNSGGRYPTVWQRQTIWSAASAISVCVLFAIVIAVIWIMANVVGFLQPILVPVAIALILAYLLDLPVTYLCRRGLSRLKAILLVFAVIALAAGALGAWILPVIWIQGTNATRDLPTYTARARDQVVDLIFRYENAFGAGRGKSGATSNALSWLLGSSSPTPRVRATSSPGPDATPRLQVSAPPAGISVADRQHIQELVQKQLPNLEKQLPALTTRAWDVVKKSVGGFLGVTGFLFSLIMVPIYLFFLLKERPAIEKHWKEYLPLRSSPLKDEVAAVLLQINSYVVAYFRGQLLVCLVDGLLIGITLSFLPPPGLNFAALIGLLVVVLTMIPYVGIVLCWIPAVLIAAAQWGDWTHPMIVTLIFIVVQNLEGLFYAPRIVGNSVGLHPMTVIVSIFVWGLLIGGLLGPLLAVPLTATIKVLLARYVWDRRLRQEMNARVEKIPIVREAEAEPATS
ncbi:MAG: AI-2E family transporter [Verrucomicrobiota bacterium]|nr:AI-2E family transporter [Verrucomicrobiota bacterium]